jgi:hypothetical protein
MKPRTSIFCVIAILFAACSGGPSEGEFVQACLNQKGVQMVKMTEEMCQCAARYSRENFEPRLQQVLLLNMQGRKQESEALIDGMSFDDRAKFAEQQFEVIGQCIMND